MEYDLPVPGFGTLRGRVKDGIAEFLGVPFGIIRERFACSELVAPPSGLVDCRTQGPLCPQTAPFDDNYNGVPIEDCAPLDIKYDEFQCLNMRVQIPLGYETPLPVVVWLHGGSNVAGTPYRGSSNAESWIKRGIAINKPFIVVSPHYRLGLFGWLPWEQSYNQAIGDQRLCIEWIHRYGPGMGADPSRISLIGQSAGASGAYAHLIDKRSTSLVRQIGLLSGHIGRNGLATQEQYKQLAESAASKIGCGTVRELQTVPASELVAFQAKHVNVFAAIAPQEMYLATPESTIASGLRIIVSDCAHDGDFIAGIPSAVEATPRGRRTAEFFTDLIFWSGANEIWSLYGPQVYRQLCDAINPYTPRLGNNHMVELHYILNGYGLKSPIIDSVQSIWTELVNLKQPWDPQTQALWLPPNELPRAIAKAEAMEKRQTKPIEKRGEFIRIVRGWPA